MGKPELSWGAAGPHAIKAPDSISHPGPTAGLSGPDAAGGIGRRAFVWSAVRGSLGLAAALTLPSRVFAQGAPAAKAFQQPESTRRMAALLAKITREADPLRNPFRNAEQAALLRDLLAKATDPRELLQIRIRLAWQLLNSGEPEGALKQYELVKQRMLEDKVPRLLGLS